MNSQRGTSTKRGSVSRWAAVGIFALGLLILFASTTLALAAVVDNGFENGTDGASLVPGWTLVGTPQRAEYDSARAKNGSLSGWIQGPTTLAYAGVGESASAGMTSDGAEQRFWLYLDTTNQFRTIDDWAAATGDRALFVQLSNNGTIYVYTNRAGNPNGYATNGYTSVGTYATGWTEFRIVYDFAAQTYTLSKRASETDAWTQLKAAGATGYGIPFRGANTITATHGLLFRAYQNANLWLDDVRYDNTGIADVDTTPPTAPSVLLSADHAGDQGGAIDLSWTAAIDNVGVTGYKLYRGTISGSYALLQTLGAVTSYTDSTAVTGTRYYYVVAAVDAAANEGPRSPESSSIAADDLAPAVPAGLSATGGTAQVDLFWTANTEPDLAGYDLYRGGVKLNTVPITATTYTDTGLAEGTTYSYRIAAVDTSANASAQSAPVIATTAGTPPVSPFDGTFENGTDGASLVPGWTLAGAAQRAEYDSARAKNGSLSGWIQGPPTLAYAGVGESASAGMTSDGAEQRFWLYFNTADQFRTIDDWAGATGDRALFVQFANNGTIYAYTNRAGNPNGYTTNGYTSVGTYSTGWTEFRIVYDFAAQTYTLSKRASATDAWTQLKAAGATGYGIPFRGANTITATHGLLFRAYQNANLWLDDVAYSPTSQPTVVASATSGGSITPSGASVVAYNGSSPVYSIVASAGYRLADVLVDGASVGTPATYQFTNVRSDHTISAVFAPISDMSMSGIDCSDCHSYDHGDPPPCLDCHSIGEFHPGANASALHTPADVTTCSGTECHSASLTFEHNLRTPDAGGAFTCLTCHNSTDPLVTAAIAAGDSACSACHPTAGDHTTLHDLAAIPVECAGSGCHTGTNLIHIHGSSTCGACHSSGDPAVASAIATGDTSCTACHPDMSTAHGGDHAGGLTEGPSCAECHNDDIVIEHDGPCAKCHESTDSRVIAAIAGNRVACGACHDPGFHPAGFFSIKTDYYQWTTTPGPRGTGPALGTIGANPENPGVHANYLATTAKCGICHSVHRAAADGVKLLPTADATCAGCHTGSTTVTAKIITWAPVNTNWVPGDLNGPAGGGGGPHNDSAADLVADGYWDGTGDTPPPSYTYGERYGCFTRRCHATNPHGAGGSAYKIFAAKLLFNETPAEDAVEYGTPAAENTYGGLDAVWDVLGATDAAVERFVSQNSSIMSTTMAGDILIYGAAPDENETHALVAGLTCGRPSNVGGHDECHAEAAYAIVDKGIVESRNHATGITAGSAYRTDNTMEEALGYGGNDNRDLKTGHVTGTFAIGDSEYAPIAGCTSCHDQTDADNTVAGNFTFPHGQTPTGATNLVLADGVTSATGARARIWSGYAGAVGAPLVYTGGTNQKAYDGQCLKCHRDGLGNGIGLTQ